MWRIASPFSAWALPLRAFGVAVFLYAFIRMLAAPDVTWIVMGIVGSLLWQAGTAAGEHSPLYRRLEGTPLKHIMRTMPVRVRSSASVSQFRSKYPTLGPGAFILTTQDGYDAGVLTPEQLALVPHESAPRTVIGQLAHPLLYLNGVREEDPVLEAFLRFRRSRDGFLPVLDGRDVVVGVVTSHDVDRWVHNRQRAVRLLDIAGKKRYQSAEEKLAA